MPACTWCDDDTVDVQIQTDTGVEWAHNACHTLQRNCHHGPSSTVEAPETSPGT